MPLLKYFAVVGSVLLGLLVVANAFMSSPKTPVFVSKFDSSTPEWLVTTDRLARPAPEPPHIATVPLEPVTAALKPAPAAQTEKAEIKKPKKTHVARRPPKTESSDDRWASNSWNGGSNGGSWNDDSWNRNSRRSNSWGDNGWGQQSWSNRDSRDAYAYAPRYRGERQRSW